MDGDATMVLSEDQINTLNRVERAGASLSLVGVSLIIATFVTVKRLRTIPNTFIFFASVANIGASIACVIGYSGIRDLQHNPDSSLCQAQGFLFQWFMQSDPWWSLAMAANVYMVFFMSFRPTSFRQYLWIYVIICYGVPAVAAFVCLFVEQHGKGHVYGDAGIWCWISSNYNTLRIYTYYLPIWVCIVVSMAIYVAVGYHVFHQRNQLRDFSLSNQAKETSWSHAEDSNRPISEDKTLSDMQTFCTITTDIQITRDSVPADGETTHSHSSASGPGPRTPSYRAGDLETGTPHSEQGGASSTRAMVSANYHTSSSVSAAQASRKPLSIFSRVRKSISRFFRRLHVSDPVKAAYLRTSFFFLFSVLVTWAPSSVNRVYTLVHPQRFQWGLNVAASAVLPLQGVWNAVIYFMTSSKLVREEWSEYRSKSRTRNGSVTNDRMAVIEGMRGRGERITDDAFEMAPRNGTLRVVRGYGLDERDASGDTGRT